MSGGSCAVSPPHVYVWLKVFTVITDCVGSVIVTVVGCLLSSAECRANATPAHPVSGRPTVGCESCCSSGAAQASLPLVSSVQSLPFQ